MTPAALKAKSADLILDYGIANSAHALNHDKYTLEALKEARSGLTAFVETLISVMEEAQGFIPGPGCMCNRCCNYRTALSSLEELTK